MVYQYTFDPGAAAEYEDAFKWYAQKSVIAADHLLVAIQMPLRLNVLTLTDTATYTKIHGNLV